jgi:membrane protein insertase Oxa1/YidC/SpoIIIJ
MWQTQRRQNRMGTNQNNPINKQMQMLTRVFPIAFGWFSWIASSGLVVYFVTSSLWRIGQQHLVLNKYYETHPEEAGKPVKKSESPPATKPAPTNPNNPNPGGSARTAGDENGARPQNPSRNTAKKKRKRRR